LIAAARQQGVGRRWAAVVLQRTELRILTDDVAVDAVRDAQRVIAVLHQGERRLLKRAGEIRPEVGAAVVADHGADRGDRRAASQRPQTAPLADARGSTAHAVPAAGLVSRHGAVAQSEGGLRRHAAAQAVASRAAAAVDSFANASGSRRRRRRAFPEIVEFVTRFAGTGSEARPRREHGHRCRPPPIRREAAGIAVAARGPVAVKRALAQAERAAAPDAAAAGRAAVAAVPPDEDRAGAAMPPALATAVLFRTVLWLQAEVPLL
jgi:hypothetical protein